MVALLLELPAIREWNASQCSPPIPRVTSRASPPTPKVTSRASPPQMQFALPSSGTMTCDGGFSEEAATWLPTWS